MYCIAILFFVRKFVWLICFICAYVITCCINVFHHCNMSYLVHHQRWFISHLTIIVISHVYHQAADHNLHVPINSFCYTP